MTQTRKKLSRVILLVTAAIILTLLITSLALAKRDSYVYPSNIIVGGVSLANLTQGESFYSLQREMSHAWGTQLKLKLSDKSVNLTMDEAGISYDYQATLRKAENILPETKGIRGAFNHILIRGKSQKITPVLTWDKEIIYKELLEIKHDYDKKPVNARIMYNHDVLDYIPHKNGYSININESLNRISAALSRGSLGPVELSVIENSPRVKLEDIKTVKDILGINVGQLQITTASEMVSTSNALNGLIIMPGDSFSLVDFTRNNGVHWEPGNIALNQLQEIFVKTGLQAGLKITPDAHLYNNLQDPVLIITELQETRLVVKVFGCQTEKGKEIKFIDEQEDVLPEVIINRDNNLSAGQRIIETEGKKGFILRSYRVVTSYGKEIEKNLVFEEFFPAVDTVVKIGPGVEK
ncbi:MAG: peptidoglycan binding domain-containing protein [Syntrophomonadaceae bacterium]|nr:peptidoglycan binding domain-containing protein [Syntrophomonadaceae bacterium]